LRYRPNYRRYLEREIRQAGFDRTNVRLTIGAIRAHSDVLTDLEKNGKIKIVGSMYRLAGGRVDFFT
jgi:carbonic anhydrase